jgi:hypothetical protein
VLVPLDPGLELPEAPEEVELYDPQEDFDPAAPAARPEDVLVANDELERVDG